MGAPDHGEFWLPHCGALLDIEPFGEKQVVAMCHHIEDPTFDATAAATNPRMKMRPIHRPPRTPADRMPHCRWRVFIDGEAKPYEQHRNLPLMEATRIAGIEIPLPDASLEPGGFEDYAGPFEPGLQLEDLGHRALLIVAQEAAVQTQLLARAFQLNIAESHGAEAAHEVGRSQWTGIAALGALRLKAALGIEGDDVAALAKVFQVHPHFHPRTYTDLRVATDGDAVRLEIAPCPALQEDDALSWLMDLGEAHHPALDAIATMVNPRAACRPLPRPDHGGLAWEVTIDPAAEPRAEPRELGLARISRGATFAFQRRRPLRP